MIGKIYTAALNLYNDGYRPPVGFYFRAGLIDQMVLGAAADFTGIDLAADSKFQEISGIEMSVEFDEIIEGGYNYVHRLPTQTRFENLVMKRGLVTNGSEFAEWCIDVIDSGFTQKIQKKSIFVELMAPENKEPLMFWSFENVYPVKWEVSPFNSMETEIVTETLEFVFENMTVY